MPEMLVKYNNFKDCNIFTITEFLETDISIQRKQYIGWYDTFDSLLLELLRNIGRESHPFESFFQGKMTVKQIRILLQELKAVYNAKAIQKWSIDLDVDITPNWE